MPCVRIPQGQPLPPGPAYDTPEECVSCRGCIQNENCCRCRGRILWRCEMAQECRNLGGIFDDFDNVCDQGGDVAGDCLGLVLDDPQCQGGGQGPTLTMPQYCRAHVESLMPKGALIHSSFYSYGGFCCDNTCSDTPCCPQERICNGNCCPENQTCIAGACCPNALACNGTCCPPDNTCVAGTCCPPERQCNDGCCADGEVCVNNQCCPFDRACGNTCCPEGFYCKDGICLTKAYYCRD